QHVRRPYILKPFLKFVGFLLAFWITSSLVIGVLTINVWHNNDSFSFPLFALICLQLAALLMNVGIGYVSYGRPLAFEIIFGGVALLGIAAAFAVQPLIPQPATYGWIIVEAYSAWIMASSLLVAAISFVLLTGRCLHGAMNSIPTFPETLPSPSARAKGSVDN
ncbi:MAG: hypothetical protein ABI995_02160, partial [Acidobacteriota bacterium]